MSSSPDDDNQTGVLNNLIPCLSTYDANQSTVDVEVQMLSFWDSIESYLKIISIPGIIMGVTVVGFLLRFFKEIIIPTVLALFLFQVSRPIVLRLHRQIIPYWTYVEENISEEEGLLLDGNKVHLLLLDCYVIEEEKSVEAAVGSSPSFCMLASYGFAIACCDTVIYLSNFSVCISVFTRLTFCNLCRSKSS